MTDTPQLSEEHFQPTDRMRLLPEGFSDHAPRILLLYGSLRARSFSRLMTEEAARVLTRLGAEPRSFDPSGLPLPDDAEADRLKVQELRELVTWSEGMVWCSPERHGAMTGIMKAQIDWIPLSKSFLFEPESRGIPLKHQMWFILFGRMDHVSTFTFGTQDAVSEVY